MIFMNEVLSNVFGLPLSPGAASSRRGGARRGGAVVHRAGFSAQGGCTCGLAHLPRRRQRARARARARVEGSALAPARNGATAHGASGAAGGLRAARAHGSASQDPGHVCAPRPGSPGRRALFGSRVRCSTVPLLRFFFLRRASHTKKLPQTEYRSLPARQRLHGTHRGTRCRCQRASGGGMSRWRMAAEGAPAHVATLVRGSGPTPRCHPLPTPTHHHARTEHSDTAPHAHARRTHTRPPAHRAAIRRRCRQSAWSAGTMLAPQTLRGPRPSTSRRPTRGCGARTRSS